jgi:alkylation response protein AidB-like acyl-CoA dehydrogenase
MIELSEIRSLARDFAQAELRPGVEQWDHEAALGESVLPQLAELGFLGMLVSEEDGGAGFGMPAFVAALEEIAWGEPATALLVLVQQVVARGLGTSPADVRGRWLGGIASGELRGCYAFGDDVALHATQDGDAWRVSGSAPFVLHAGDGAAVALVRAGTDAGQATFAVALDDGAAFGERLDTLGLRPLHVSPLVLEAAAAVRLDDAAYTAASHTGRLGVAAVALGIAQAALDHALGSSARSCATSTRSASSWPTWRRRLPPHGRCCWTPHSRSRPPQRPWRRCLPAGRRCTSRRKQCRSLAATATCATTRSRS